MFGHRAGAEINRPIPQHGTIPESAVLAPQLRVPDCLQHNGVTVVIGVGNVEDVAGIDIEPAHLAERVVAAEHPQPGAVLVLPPKRHIAASADRDVDVEHDR